MRNAFRGSLQFTCNGKESTINWSKNWSKSLFAELNVKNEKGRYIYMYTGNYTSGMNKTRLPRVVLINAKLRLNIHGLGGWWLLLSFVAATWKNGERAEENIPLLCFVETHLFQISSQTSLSSSCFVKIFIHPRCFSPKNCFSISNDVHVPFFLNILYG